MTTRRWLFGDQLGPHWLDSPHQPVLLVESRNRDLPAVLAQERRPRKQGSVSGQVALRSLRGQVTPRSMNAQVTSRSVGGQVASRS